MLWLCAAETQSNIEVVLCCFFYFKFYTVLPPLPPSSILAWVEGLKVWEFKEYYVAPEFWINFIIHETMVFLIKYDAVQFYFMW